MKAAVEKGVAALSKIQEADGGFSTGGAATCESNAQVLVALAELGISLDDSRFVKNGNTALDALLTYANADGSFRHALDGDANEMATEQALYALAAVKLAESGKSLYKMDAPKADTQRGTFRDVVGHKNQKAIEALAEKGVINGMTADTFAPDAGAYAGAVLRDRCAGTGAFAGENGGVHGRFAVGLVLRLRRRGKQGRDRQRRWKWKIQSAGRNYERAGGHDAGESF